LEQLAINGAQKLARRVSEAERLDGDKRVVTTAIPTSAPAAALQGKNALGQHGVSSAVTRASIVVRKVCGASSFHLPTGFGCGSALCGERIADGEAE